MTLSALEDYVSERPEEVNCKRLFQVLHNHYCSLLHAVRCPFRLTGRFSLKYCREKHDEMEAVLSELSSRKYCTKARFNRLAAELGVVRNELEFLEKFRFVRWL